MKSLLLFSLLSVTAWASTADGWKVVAETSNNCQDKVQIIAKEGEPFVYAVQGDKKTRLDSQGGATYTKDGTNNITFSSGTTSYFHPAYVSATPPKIKLAEEDCRMSFR